VCAGFPGDDGRWLHFGVTSSDVLDTALALLMVEAADIILGDMTRLLETLEGLARKHAMTVTVGRTHGVHAEPTTLGLKFLNWYKELQRQEQRILFAREDVRVGKISGAVGTYATVDPAVEEEACRILKLVPAPVSTQILQRDRHAAYVCALANLGGTLEKIAVWRSATCSAPRSWKRRRRFRRPEGLVGHAAQAEPDHCEQICGARPPARATPGRA
jgi:adenylosuccinate lyase